MPSHSYVRSRVRSVITRSGPRLARSRAASGAVTAAPPITSVARSTTGEDRGESFDRAPELRHGPLADCAGWESPHDHVALYLQNGNAYLEAQLGAAKAGAAAFNVNYRYVADELIYLLRDSGATAIVVHGQFTPTLAEVLPSLPELRVILQVDDDSGHPLLPGAVFAWAM